MRVPAPVDLGIGGQRRRLAHQVGALDQHVRRGEADAVAAHRVDREEADVGLPALDRLDRLGGGVEGQQPPGRRRARRRARRDRSTETPTASPPAGSRRARIGLPRLIEARSRPVGASAAVTSGEAAALAGAGAGEQERRGAGPGDHAAAGNRVSACGDGSAARRQSPRMDVATPDVIVVGLGAVGSALCHHLAAGGAKVVGIDRFRPPHDQGSSHGLTRITRLAVGEGAAFVPLVMRSHAALARARGGERRDARSPHRRPRDRLGRLATSRRYHGQPGFLAQTIALAAALRHRPRAARRGGRSASASPPSSPPTTSSGYFEPRGRRALSRAHRRRAARAGAARTARASARRARCSRSRPRPGGVEVVTDRGRLVGGARRRHRRRVGARPRRRRVRHDAAARAAPGALLVRRRRAGPLCARALPGLHLDARQRRAARLDVRLSDGRRRRRRRRWRASRTRSSPIPTGSIGRSPRTMRSRSTRPCARPAARHRPSRVLRTATCLYTSTPGRVVPGAAASRVRSDHLRLGLLGPRLQAFGGARRSAGAAAAGPDASGLRSTPFIAPR